jgi:hypothetical protein
VGGYCLRFCKELAEDTQDGCCRCYAGCCCENICGDTTQKSRREAYQDERDKDIKDSDPLNFKDFYI